MKSKIKKEQVLHYLMEKLNDNYYGVPFYMGIDGMPIYKPVLQENGDITGFEFVDEETYQQEIINKIPVSLIVSNGDYAVIKDLSGNGNDVNGASFRATLGFLLQTENTRDYKVMLESLEQVRDKLLGDLGILKAVQYDYENDTQESYPYLVATHCEDVQIGGELELNGKRFLEYILNVDLDISDNITYGNQFEWYMAPYQKQWNSSNLEYYTNCKRQKIELDQESLTSPDISLFPSVNDIEFGSALKVEYSANGVDLDYAYYVLEYVEQPYERIMPLVISWGSSQSLSGFQMLRNDLLPETQIKKAQLVHSLASSRGWAITTTLQFQDTKPILVKLFRETFPHKDYMQLPYKLKAIYKKMTINGETIAFETFSDLSFEMELIPQDSSTSSVHGDNIVFTLSFVPKWV